MRGLEIGVSVSVGVLGERKGEKREGGRREGEGGGERKEGAGAKRGREARGGRMDGREGGTIERRRTRVSVARAEGGHRSSVSVSVSLKKRE
jgi:hypothetical protein